MKYFTKEWYELCQKTSFYLNLEEEKQAETFSEEYFQQLYNNELNSWLELQEEISSILESNDDDQNEYEPFNKNLAIKQFHDGFIYNKHRLKNELPETILNQIADIRVFALYKATRTVISAVTKFSEENERSVTATSAEYRKYFKEASSSFEKDIVENFGFHDCTIIKSVQHDRSLTLHLDNTGGFTDIEEVTFENYQIIKQDGLLEDSWWLYNEVYKVNDNYEFHVLLQKSEMGLMDFIICADQVSFKSNKNHE
ncbi:DUF4085 family protein [Lysinibacillus sp. NPDC093712]|uniref:DUF4085 family protein n=1 Tax=Lysinibacillus sp. NPDC093712 TaxID=3390579 RepID=UPI003D09369E